MFPLHRSDTALNVVLVILVWPWVAWAWFGLICVMLCLLPLLLVYGAAVTRATWEIHYFGEEAHA